MAAKEPTPCVCSLFTAAVPNEDGSGQVLEGTNCEATTSSTFAPGHDAKFKSFLVKAALAGHPVYRNVGGTDTEVGYKAAAAEFNFTDQVEHSLSVAANKANAKAVLAEAKAVRKQEREQAKAARKIVRDEAFAAQATKRATKRAAEDEAKRLAKEQAAADSAQADALAKNVDSAPARDAAPAAADTSGADQLANNLF